MFDFANRQPEWTSIREQMIWQKEQNKDIDFEIGIKEWSFLGGIIRQKALIWRKDFGMEIYEVWNSVDGMMIQ